MQAEGWLRCALLCSVALWSSTACDDDADETQNSSNASTRSSSSSSSRARRSSSASRDRDAGRDEREEEEDVADAGRGRREPGSDKLVPVTIRFVARLGSKELTCRTQYTKVGAERSTVTLRDMRLFVQDVALLDEDGEAVPVQLDVRKPWQSEEVALLDFEDVSGECGAGTPETNTKLTGRVPDRRYTGIRFSNGVPEALNHADPDAQSDPLNSFADLSWGGKNGYRFAKIELLQLGPDAGGGHGLLHLGSTACVSDAQSGSVKCEKPNRSRIELEPFDPSRDSIAIDIEPIFADVDLTQTTDCRGTGEACAPMFKAMGVDLSTGKPRASQSVYSVE